MVDFTAAVPPPSQHDRPGKGGALLTEITKAIAASFDVSLVFPVAARQMRQILPYDTLVILLRAGEIEGSAIDHLAVAYCSQYDLDAAVAAANELWTPADFSFGQTLLATRPTIVDDLAATANQYRGDLGVLGAGRAALVTPICTPLYVFGWLVLVSHTPGLYRLDDLLLAEPVADLLAVALQHQRLSRRSCDLAVAEERRRLVREMHDTLAQALAGILINLEFLKSHLALHTGVAAGVLADTETLARRALEEARQAILGLHPVALEHHSLREALSEELAALARRDNLSTQFYCAGLERPLLPEQAAAFFRIAQEALRNVHKHAAAHHVLLSLIYGEKTVVLTVEDDGVGFLPGARTLDQQSGLGLQLMAERAHNLGGHVEVTSQLGHGTSVRAELAYTSPEAAFPAAADKTNALPHTLPALPHATPPATPQRPIRVLVVDNHTTARQGIRRILEGNADIDVVGEAADGLAAVEQTAHLCPDVVLLDVQMPRLSGIEALPQLRAANPNVEVVMLTMFGDDEAVFASLQAGARGYVLKDAPPEMFVAAVLAASKGQSLLPPPLATRVVNRLTVLVQQQEAADALTARELEVLQYLAKGLRYKDIAAQLGVTIKTIGYHATNIFQKLQVGSRGEAVAVANERGLLEQTK